MRHMHAAVLLDWRHECCRRCRTDVFLFGLIEKVKGNKVRESRKEREGETGDKVRATGR